MSLDKVCTQYPISKSILTNINSFNDITNLMSSSYSLYENLHGFPIKKTIESSSNIIIIEHESNDRNSQNNYDNIVVSFQNVRTTLSQLYRHIANHSYENFEHINTIRIELFDNYEEYEINVLDSFSECVGLFINELFKLCPNADTLELYSISSIQCFIIQHLKSPQIKRIKDLRFSSISSFSRTKPESSHMIVNGLSNLEEIDIFIRECDIAKKEFYMTGFQSILEHLSKKEKNMINISGSINTYYLNIFKELVELTLLNEINISLKGCFLCNQGFFSECLKPIDDITRFPTDNITSITVSLYNIDIFNLFFKTIQSFQNLTSLRIYFSEQLFENILDTTVDNIYTDSGFDEEILKRIPDVEELCLKIQDNERIYRIMSNYQESFPVKNKLVNQLLMNLKGNVKVLYLKGVPDMSMEMGNIVSRTCPNITNLILAPLHSLDSTFVEDMHSLKFLCIKGIYKLNVPEEVQLLIVKGKKDNLSKEIAKVNDMNSYNYFSNQFNRMFKVSIRCIDNEYLLYNVFLNNIFMWNMYLKKINQFRGIF